MKLPPLENVRGFLKKDCEANYLKAWEVGGGKIPKKKDKGQDCVTN